MEKSSAVKYPNNYARSITRNKKDFLGLEITEMRMGKDIIKGPIAELIELDKEMRSTRRKYVNLANESRAVFSVRTAAPPIADLVCEILTTHPEWAKNINEKSPYIYLELTWEQLLYYAIDNEPRMQKYLLQLIADLVDGERAWVIDYGTGKGDIAKPFFISDIEWENVEDGTSERARLNNLRQYKEGKEETPPPRIIKRITLFVYRRLFQPCWIENKGVQNRGAGYLFTDHAFTTNFLRAYADLLSGRTEESQAFLCMYNPQRKVIINEKYKQFFDSRLFAMAVWFMIHAEANVDKPFAHWVKKNSDETLAMLQQVAPNMVSAAGKGEKKAYYIRDKLDAQIFVDTACWILNYGARQGFFEHFKAIPTKCLYERGKRESDFCLEISFAVNTPKGEGKTMRNVQPYNSNLKERLLEQNPPSAPIEGHTTLWL